MAYPAEMAQLMTDVENTFGETVTLSKRAHGSIDATTGLRTFTTTTQSITANRLPSRQGTRGIGNGRAREEERTYELVIASVTLGTPEPGWSITDGGKVFHVNEVDIDAHRLNYILRTKASV